MLPDKKTNTNIGVGLGIVLQLSRFILVRQGIITPDVGSAIWVLGLLVFVWGCMNYAEGKGVSKWFGLLGILSLIGLLVLFFLPDHHKDDKCFAAESLPPANATADLRARASAVSLS
ncbi:MAG TPA: hypothetical protein VN578_05840 [Candidatus Binatia bacterium]|jgi:hypothetical protein|nr:hypothetical protein [Candidatus Binatia bacterium]